MEEVPGATATAAPHAPPPQKPKNPAKPKSDKQKLENAPLMNILELVSDEYVRICLDFRSSLNILICKCTIITFSGEQHCQQVPYRRDLLAGWAHSSQRWETVLWPNHQPMQYNQVIPYQDWKSLGMPQKRGGQGCPKSLSFSAKEQSLGHPWGNVSTLP